METHDGKVLTGLLASETKTSVEVLDAEGKKHVVLRTDIEQQQASPKSLMPEGFEKQLKEEEVVNLLEFLTKAGTLSATVAGESGHGGQHTACFSRSRAKWNGSFSPTGRRRRSRGCRLCWSIQRRAGAQRGAALRSQRPDGSEDASIGDFAREREGEGGPFPERGQRLGLPARQERRCR